MDQGEDWLSMAEEGQEVCPEFVELPETIAGGEEGFMRPGRLDRRP